MTTHRTITCPHNSAWRVELDASEIDHEDPGNGTPAMVYGVGRSAATYGCASDTGEVWGTRDRIEIPANVLRWLQSDEIADAVDQFIDAH